MYASFKNGAIFAGNATKDAEYRTVGEKATPLTTFDLAVGTKEEPQYVKCDAFGKVLAEYAAQIKKGKSVFVAGVIRTREYEGKEYKSLNVQWLNVIDINVSSLPSIPSGFTEIEDDGEPPF